MMQWIILALSLVIIGMANGLCMPEHVQTQFCNADYVVRVRVMSAVKHEVPELPPRPTPLVTTQNRTTDSNEDKIKEKTTQGVAPWRRGKQAPAPFRFVRSIVSNRRSYRQYPFLGWRYQEIKIKRILKGVGLVENTQKTHAQLRTNKTTRYSSRMYVSPWLQLKPGKAYILAGKVISNRLYLSRCNWYSAWDKLSAGQIRDLKKTFVQGCKCRVQFCYKPGCEKTKAKGVCMWRPQGFYPVDDCRYHHSLCRVHNGNCQWVDNEGFQKCMKNYTALIP
ncbi:metalloproteinase inhibitor 3-like [Actinia tenebrosa]|uniref:Metalloproteinase inhibitor 3-like n=1 Tax=Actinia tenebrosa TaxID=6105 RepID=A0A6P8HNS3_ACTTE|nr:metalloproteinase inhibitor 3-like [Actinia tenebrosa]